MEHVPKRILGEFIVYLLYDGPSLIDGKPIVVLATGFIRPSTNKKTGPVIQTYIMRKDIPPAEALKSEQDSSVCGTCSLRGGSCYVLVHQAPSAVWHAANKRDMTLITDLAELGQGQVIRIGSYGDPAAVPIEIWEKFASESRNHTGYTHGWSYCDPKLQDYCMASVESVEEKELANAAGWKTFRIKKEGTKLQPEESLCAAEKNEDITCKLCKLCDGKRKNVAITIHGTNWKVKAFNSLTQTV